MQDIGFIGLGAMGMAMARNLRQAGFQLQVFNRTPGKAEQLAAESGVVTVKSRPSEVAVAGGVIISMLADDKALEHESRRDDSLVAPGDRTLEG